jgi:hypothetical protein
VAVALLVAGVLAALVAAALIGAGVRTPAPAADTPVAVPARIHGEAAVRSHPVALEARLDEPMSRWLWVVKWLLASPHLIGLALLWPAVVVVTVVAFVAILVTGRYPRALFDFNVGVLRWTVARRLLRAVGARHRPLPAVLAGGRAGLPGHARRAVSGSPVAGAWCWSRAGCWRCRTWSWSRSSPAARPGGWSGRSLEWPGLIPVLALVAGVVLLVQGRYHRDLFTLLVGLNRWVYRVAAYVLLMRDEYPPFRLER